MQKATPIYRLTTAQVNSDSTAPSCPLSATNNPRAGIYTTDASAFDVEIPTPILNHKLTEYAIDGLTFLKESGLVRLIDSRSEWQKKLLIEMGEKNKSGRLFRGKGDDILTDEKNNPLELATIRGLCATTLRVKLPPGYKTPPIMPSSPEVAEFFGYNTHSTIVYAYKRYSKDILQAIKRMGSNRRPIEIYS